MKVFESSGGSWLDLSCMLFSMKSQIAMMISALDSGLTVMGNPSAVKTPVATRDPTAMRVLIVRVDSSKFDQPTSSFGQEGTWHIAPPLSRVVLWHLRLYYALS
jgi:hypothetical protein